ncbi:MAG: PIN domain-containing protein [Candidatus Dadabacteria bacterium]|nr:MAG: PIN domain-containing protein [Candidatus Dadabacteria bacterium]
MIGLDTNVLVRYLVQDDPDQARDATALIEGAAGRGERLFLCSVVLCEVVWVLEAAYGVPKREIAETLEKILATRQLDVEHHDCARAALADFRAGKADFSDCFIGRIHEARGCERTATFDRAAARLPTFSLP